MKVILFIIGFFLVTSCSFVKETMSRGYKVYHKPQGVLCYEQTNVIDLRIETPSKLKSFTPDRKSKQMIINFETR